MRGGAVVEILDRMVLLPAGRVQRTVNTVFRDGSTERLGCEAGFLGASNADGIQ